MTGEECDRVGAGWQATRTPASTRDSQGNEQGNETEADAADWVRCPSPDALPRPAVCGTRALAASELRHGTATISAMTLEDAWEELHAATPPG